MRKVFINLLIILIWLAFGYGYFTLYQTNRPAQPEEGEVDGQTEIEAGQTGGVEMALAATSRSIRPDRLCLNSSALAEPSWTNPNLQQAIRELNVGTLRIPGGIASGYWNWQSGQITPLEAGQEPRRADNNLESYLAGLQATNTEPILVLNMVTADLSDQLAFLETVEAAGIAVRAVELGYKPYQARPESADPPPFANGDEYVAQAAVWAEAIREAFPETTIAVVGALPGVDGFSDWNSAVFSLAASQGLAVTLYPFLGPGLEPGQSFNEADIAAVLGVPFQSWRRQTRGQNAPLTNLPPEVPVWLTEYNIWQELPDQLAVSRTWAQALLVLSQSLLFLEDERVEYTCVHQLLGPQQTGAYLFRNQRFDLLPTGRAVQSLSRVMEGMTAAREIEFANTPAPHGPIDFDYPTVLGWTFSDENGRQSAIILNLSFRRLEIGVGNLPTDLLGPYQQTLGVPTRRVRSNEGIEVIEGDLTDKNFLVLPRYSVTIFPSGAGDGE